MVIFIGKSLISLRVLILKSEPLVLRTSCIEKITNPEEFDMYCHRSVTKAYHYHRSNNRHASALIYLSNPRPAATSPLRIVTRLVWPLPCSVTKDLWDKGCG